MHVEATHKMGKCCCPCKAAAVHTLKNKVRIIAHCWDCSVVHKTAIARVQNVNQQGRLAEAPVPHVRLEGGASRCRGMTAPQVSETGVGRLTAVAGVRIRQHHLASWRPCSRLRSESAKGRSINCLLLKSAPPALQGTRLTAPELSSVCPAVYTKLPEPTFGDVACSMPLVDQHKFGGGISSTTRLAASQRLQRPGGQGQTGCCPCCPSETTAASCKRAQAHAEASRWSINHTNPV